MAGPTDNYVMNLTTVIQEDIQLFIARLEYCWRNWFCSRRPVRVILECKKFAELPERKCVVILKGQCSVYEAVASCRFTLKKLTQQNLHITIHLFSALN